MVVFMIVGKTEPIYEAEFNTAAKEDLAYLHQFIIHSSLDMVDGIKWVNNNTFLRVVDRFNNLSVSAYLTPGGVNLLLLHESKSEDAVKVFFTEVHELYVKYILNPFYSIDSPIVSPNFDSRVRILARKILSL